MTPVSPEDKRLLLQFRRPRWQHLAQKSLHTQAARRDKWETDVRKMLEEQIIAATVPGAKRAASFVEHMLPGLAENSSLKKAEQVMRQKAFEYETYQREQERTGGLTCPPPPVRLVELRDDPPQKKRKLGDATSGTIARAAAKAQVCMALRNSKVCPAALQGCTFPDTMVVYFSSNAIGKHGHTARHLGRDRTVWKGSSMPAFLC